MSVRASLPRSMSVRASLPFSFGNNGNNSMQWTEGGAALAPFSDDWRGPLDEHSMAPVPSTSHSPLASSASMDFSYILATETAKQKQELDLFLRLQNERLAAGLHQQRIQHAASLITKVRSKACALLRQKEDELEKAWRRAVELGELLKRAEEEKGLWQRVAKQEAAIAAALRNTLERVQEPCCSATGEAGEEDAESTSTGRGPLLCWVCGSRDSCMLLIPCRHLCSCKPCAASLDACPVCGFRKRSHLEVFLE